MKIDEKMIDSGLKVYYEKPFLDILEAHMVYLRTNRETMIINVSDQDQAVYDKDLYGYLTHLKIPAKLHWIIMRMNSMYNANEFDKKHFTLLLPSETVVDKIRQSYIVKTNSL